MRELRLFVWREYARDYTSGLAVALAHDSEEARNLIEAEHGYRDTALAAAPEVFDLVTPVAFARAGGG